MSTLKKIVKIFEPVFYAVIKQEHLLGSGKGIDKRKAVIEIINALVDVPFLPEFAEGFIIGLLVDFLVWVFNKLFGHDWKDQPALGVPDAE